MLIRDLSSQRPQPFTLPAALQTYVDEVFGSLVLRLTDERDGSQNSHGYSYYCPWSCDGRLLVVALGWVPWLFSFDPETGTTVKLRPLLEGSQIPAAIEWSSIFWDSVDPAVCYAVEPAKQRIWRINTALRTFGVLPSLLPSALGRRFNADVGGAIAEIHQHSASEAGKIWAFHARMKDGSIRAFVWDRTNDKLLAVPAWPSTGAALNECQISLCGNVLRLCFDDETVVLLRWREGVAAVLASTDPVNGIVEHIDWNRDWMASGRKGDNAIVLRRLEDPDGRIQTILSPGWKAGHHVALAQGFAVASFYVGDRTWGAFECELVKIYPDGSYVRFAHTGSLGVDGTLDAVGNYVGKGYFSQPRAAVSRCGRWVIWTSDLGLSTSAALRSDVLIARVPADDAVIAATDALAAVRGQLIGVEQDLDAARLDRDNCRARLEAVRTAGGWE